MYRAIIADDERIVRNTVLKLGKWSEYGVEIAGQAADGDSLLKLIEELQPHVVFIDMKMPGLSGAELIRRIRSDYPNIKIVIISGFNDFEFTRQAITSRAIDYVLKPIGSEELNTAIKSAVEMLESEPHSGTSPRVGSIADEGTAEIHSRNIQMLIKEIKEYLDQNYGDRISLDELAGRFHLSREYISKVFKDVMKVNLSFYVNKIRIERAKSLLLQSDKKNAEIAQMLGYNDESHFSKVFKKIVGLTPREYRKI